MMNRFLARQEIIDVLLANEKADALIGPVTQKLMRRLGTIWLSLFGYPYTVSSRSRANDVLRLMSHLRGSLIDIGCSHGAAHTFELAKRLAPNPVLGLDIDPVNIDVAKRLNTVLAFRNLDFEIADIAVVAPQ